MTNKEDANYIIYKNYRTDIGWDKAYCKNGSIGDDGWGYPKKEATLYTEEEAKEICASLNEKEYIGEYCNENYQYEILKFYKWE